MEQQDYTETNKFVIGLFNHMVKSMTDLMVSQGLNLDSEWLDIFSKLVWQGHEATGTIKVLSLSNSGLGEANRFLLHQGLIGKLASDTIPLLEEIEELAEEYNIDLLTSRGNKPSEFVRNRICQNN